MSGWLIYVWAFSVILVLSALGRVFLFFKRPDVVSRLDIYEAFVSLIAIPALFGFAYQKPHGFRIFWIIFCVALSSFSIYQFFTPKMKKLYRKGWLVSTGTIAFQTTIGFPALWALFRYSFFETWLWK